MEEKAILKKVLEETEEGVVVLAKKGTVLYANPIMEKFFLNGVDTIRGRRPEEVITHPPLVKAIENAVHSKETFTKEIALNDAESMSLNVSVRERRDFKFRSIPFDEGFICFLRDITEERRLEGIKRDFVSNVSHELRTPLANIKGYTETLLNNAVEDKERLKSFLQIIDKHTARMTRLIDDLLILSRLETHEIPLSISFVDMKEVITSVLQGFERQAEDKRITLISKFDARPLIVEADRERIEQVLINLVDNAIKYTPEGGRVAVKAFSTNEGIEVDVEDTGIGIPEKDIPRIFERFYRVDKARSRELGGTGLGLTIVKHIILSHKGRVGVKSEVGKGTRFGFIIPIRESESPLSFTYLKP